MEQSFSNYLTANHCLTVCWSANATHTLFPNLVSLRTFAVLQLNQRLSHNAHCPVPPAHENLNSLTFSHIIYIPYNIHLTACYNRYWRWPPSTLRQAWHIKYYLKFSSKNCRYCMLSLTAALLLKHHQTYHHIHGTLHQLVTVHFNLLSVTGM